MNASDKKILIIGGVILAVILAGYFVIRGRTSQTVENRQDILPTSEVIPTVDSSVIVKLEPFNQRREVTLAVENLPNGTKTLEYEITYETEGGLSEGSASSPADVSGKKKFEKKICLCTQSASVKRFHKLSNYKIKVNLKFEGSYGKKLFEKEFKI